MPSFALVLMTLWLRLVEKPALARERDIGRARERLERNARRLFRLPPGAEVDETRRGALRLATVRSGRPGAGRVLLYLHGGAFIMGSPETHLPFAATLAEAAEATAFAPDYRLAPEHPFPAAVEDAVEALRAAIEAAGPGGRVVVAGDSAGGGLAFALLVAARREGLPDPAGVLAFSPWVDMTMRAPSLRRNARKDPLLPVSRMKEVIRWRMGDHDPEDPLASPVFARFDRPPPPAMIQIGRGEILEDDARGMTATLRAAGGDVRLDWTGRTPHAFQLAHRTIPEARLAVARAVDFLRERFAAADAAADGGPSRPVAA